MSFGGTSALLLPRTVCLFALLLSSFDGSAAATVVGPLHLRCCGRRGGCIRSAAVLRRKLKRLLPRSVLLSGGSPSPEGGEGHVLPYFYAAPCGADCERICVCRIEGVRRLCPMSFQCVNAFSLHHFFVVHCAEKRFFSHFLCYICVVIFPRGRSSTFPKTVAIM